jgi:molybdopterin-guanine dinucleotide biosynthesis protein A
VLAADLPHVRRALPLVTDRVDASEEWDGWMASDPQGRPQPLLAAYRSTSLARRCAQLHEQGALTGASVRLLITGLRLCAVAVPAELCRDVDTPADAEHFAIALSTSQETHDRLIPAYAER